MSVTREQIQETAIRKFVLAGWALLGSLENPRTSNAFMLEISRPYTAVPQERPYAWEHLRFGHNG